MKSKQQIAKDDYLKNNVETFVLRVDKGMTKIIDEHAKSKGLTRNAYVKKLINDDIGEIPLSPMLEKE